MVCYLGKIFLKFRIICRKKSILITWRQASLWKFHYPLPSIFGTVFCWCKKTKKKKYWLATSCWVDLERTGRWPIFNNDQFTLLYEFDTLQIIYSTKWQHLYWVRYKILNNIKLSPSQLCLSRISLLRIDTPYSIYVELINYFGEKNLRYWIPHQDS